MGLNKVFFDANVLLSLLLKRPGNVAAENFQLNLGRDNSPIHISVLTGHLVAHFRPESISLRVIELFLSDYALLDMTQADFHWAFTNRADEDFEDALQIAIAIRNGCSEFVTFDKKLASNYSNLPTLKITLL